MRQALLQSVVVKREPSQKIKLVLLWLIHIPIASPRVAQGLGARGASCSGLGS